MLENFLRSETKTTSNVEDNFLLLIFSKSLRVEIAIVKILDFQFSPDISNFRSSESEWFLPS